jgi:peroxiredoxin
MNLRSLFTRVPTASTAEPVRPGRGSLYRAALLACGLCLSLSMSGCLLGRTQAAPAVATVGLPAPDFALHTVGPDQVIRLSEFRGKPVILNFFCGCHYCSELARTWTRERGKIGSAQMLAVMFNSETFNPVFVRNFREATHFDAPVLADLGSETAMRYRSLDCPMVWVIDRKGIVRYRNEDRTAPPDKIIAGALAALNDS